MPLFWIHLQLIWFVGLDEHVDQFRCVIKVNVFINQSMNNEQPIVSVKWEKAKNKFSPQIFLNYNNEVKRILISRKAMLGGDLDRIQRLNL